MGHQGPQAQARYNQQQQAQAAQQAAQAAQQAQQAPPVYTTASGRSSSLGSGQPYSYQNYAAEQAQNDKVVRPKSAYDVYLQDYKNRWKQVTDGLSPSSDPFPRICSLFRTKLSPAQRPLTPIVCSSRSTPTLRWT